MEQPRFAMKVIIITVILYIHLLLFKSYLFSIFFQNNYINVRNLSLIDGNRYFICVFANETAVEYEKFSQDLAAVSVCSNGVVVDLEAPQKGSVWIGYSLKHTQVQVCHGSV